MKTKKEYVEDPAVSSRMGWWRDAKIGMFIHWGPYASLWKTEYPARCGWDLAWARHSLRIPTEEFHKLSYEWNPYKFNAESIVDLAKSAGMNYMIFTSKHHDGFCMFDSELTDFKITNSSLGRDVSKELTDACAAQNLPFGFYYSPRDWDHPDYLPQYEYYGKPGPNCGGWWGYKPGSFTEKIARNQYGGPEDLAADDRFIDCGCEACKANLPIVESRDPAKAEFSRYLAYERGQVKELITKYGDVKVVWYDGREHSIEAAGTHETLAMIRGVNPNILVNDRIGSGGFQADFGIAESYIPETGAVRDWEACLTMTFSWGYDHDAQSFFTPEDIIKQVVDVVSKGGNILINISPDDMGLVPEYQAERLRILGQWLYRFGDAVYGTQRVDIPPRDGVLFTCKEDKIYALQTQRVGSDIWIPNLKLKDDAEVRLLGCDYPVRWDRPTERSLFLRRDHVHDKEPFPGKPEDGLHICVGEIPTTFWYGEPVIAFEITGAEI